MALKFEDKGLGPVKRFGVRYGRTVKHKLAAIEIEQKKPQKCPFCNKLKTKRVSVGIYVCRSCGSKFTGKAYTVEKKIVFEEELKPEIKEEVEEEIIEE